VQVVAIVALTMCEGAASGPWPSDACAGGGALLCAAALLLVLLV